MREYDDDNIRLYAPVLQRVIVLAAVIIAVPVMMWTITTFVRSYVARPKVPTFQHVTVSEPAQSLPPAAPLAASPPPSPPQAPPQTPLRISPPPPPALADAGAAGNDGRGPLPDAGNGPSKGPIFGPPPDAGSVAIAPVTGLAHAPPSASAVAGAPSAPPSGPPAGPPSSPAASAPVASAAIAPPAPPAAPAQPAQTQPAQTQPASAAPRIAANTSGTAPATPGKGGSAWPNPNAENAPSIGESPQPPAPTQTASTEAPQVAAPIAGRIPLPRHRPSAVAAAETGSITSMAPTGPVPLPRVRPADAPADASPVTSAPYGYDPGLGTGH